MVTGFEDRGDSVAVTTADGRSFSGAAIVAADGVRSLFRQKLIGDGDPRPIGYVAHRTIVPMAELKVDVPRDCVALWGGPGLHIVQYPLRHNTLFNIVAVFRTSTHGDKGDVASYRAELEHTYRKAHPSMRGLLAMMDLGRRWQIGDRAPVRHWHKGRVVLLGDAAHPPLQSLAQGACMAIEDGLCLGELIEDTDGDFPAAFRRFETARLLRTARVHSNPGRCGISTTSTKASPAMSAMRPWPIGTRRICTNAYPGSTLALLFRQLPVIETLDLSPIVDFIALPANSAIRLTGAGWGILADRWPSTSPF